MYKVRINTSANSDSDSLDLDIEIKNDQFFLNDQAFPIDIVKVKEGYYHILRNNKSYIVEILQVETATKEVIIKINNNVFTVSIKDKMDLLLDRLGMTPENTTKLSTINAPMPGLILDIPISEGQELVKGETVMILEAMKMENVIKSPGEGIVKKINVSVGQSVEKNFTLVQF